MIAITHNGNYKTHARRSRIENNFKFQKNLKFSEILWENTPFSFKTPFCLQRVQTALIGSTEVFKQVIYFKNGAVSKIYFIGKNASEFFDSEEKLVSHVRLCQVGK